MYVYVETYSLAMSENNASPCDVHTSDAATDHTVMTDSGDQSILQKKFSDPSDSLNDNMPPSSDTEDKNQSNIKKEERDGSLTKKFIYWSVVVAVVAVFSWYLYSTHTEMVALQSEIKTLQVWMAVKMEKLQDKTITKMDEVHTKVAKIIKDSSTKEMKLLKNLGSKTKL